MIKNHFQYVPQTVGKKRSVFDYNSPQSGSYELGRVYPIDVIECAPGDTYSLDLAGLIRSGTLIRPIMDDLIVDVVCTAHRKRNLWTHWPQFIGSNDDVAFTETNSYTAPMANYFGSVYNSGMTNLYTPEVAADSGYETLWRQLFEKYNNSLACHFGLPVAHVARPATNAKSVEIDVMPFRAYYQQYNEFWRDENLLDPILWSKTDTGYSGEMLSADGLTPKNFSTSVIANATDWFGGYCAKASKTHDYFTSLLNSPVRNVDGYIGVPIDALAPVITQNATIDADLRNANPLVWYDTGSSAHGDYDPQITDGVRLIGVNAGGYTIASGTASSVNEELAPANLYADLRATSGVALNGLRESILLNRMYEMRMRIGGRYPELIFGEFGVHPDIQDRAELLCHKRFNLNVSEIISQTETLNSSNETVNSVGEVGAMSKTAIRGSLFTKSFDEHSLVLVCICIRQRKQIYTQGLAKKWTRKNFLDYYWPSLNGLGDVPAYKKEAFCGFTDSNVSKNDEILGYQEYGVDQKVQYARAVGYMNPNNKMSFASWNMAESYSSAPTLKNLITADKSNFNRNLVITDGGLAPQFFGDFIVHGKKRTVMPVYNIPGVGGVL